MSKLMDEKTKLDLQKILANLESPVSLLFFTQEHACPECNQQQRLLEELVSLTDKLELKIYDFLQNRDETLDYRIDKIPATAVIGKKDYGVRFYGITAGYEFTSLVEAVLMASTEHSGLEPQLEGLIGNIKEQVHIQVIVTLTCPARAHRCR